ncbi:MAG: AsmA family protein [Desulfobacteraceae bacterium]|nr:AsmA family protein [Desulfobacteraceae bacterium]MBC2757369.1 AsmA family protein [Desulfobacteraceae bacterium]
MAAKQRNNHWLRRVLYSLLITTGIIALLLFFIITIDIEVHRNRILSFVENHLDRKVRINGKIRLEKSLCPKIIVEDIIIGNPSWAQAPYLAKAKRFEIQIALLPLLMREIKIMHFKLTGAHVHLESGPATASNRLKKKKKALSFELVPAMSALVVEDAQITFHAGNRPDRILSPDRTLSIDRLESVLEMGAPIDLDCKLRYEDIPVQLSVTGDQLVKNKPLPINMKFSASDLTAEFQGFWQKPFQGFEVLGAIEINIAKMTVISKFLGQNWELDQPLHVSGRLDTDGRRVNFREVSLEAAGVSSSGGAVYSPDNSPRLDLNLKDTVIDLEKFINSDEKGKTGSPAVSSSNKSQGIIPDFSINSNLLKNFNFAIQMAELKVMYNAELLTTMKGNLSIVDGVLSVLPFESWSHTGASSQASLVLDTTKEPPAAELFWKTENLDYGLILNKMDITDDVIGTLDWKLDVKGRGATFRELLGNANGGLEIVTDKGRIPKKFLELWGGGLVRLLIPTTWFEEDVTDLNCAVCRFNIEDGIMQSNVLLSDTERITVAGEIALDLKTEQVSGLFEPKNKQVSLLRLGTPLKVSGTLAKIKAESAESGLVTLGKLIIGVSNPSTIILIFGDLGTTEKNPCEALLQQPLP